MENAYKQIPIQPSDFELLGFKISDSYYFDKTLPFGLSYSCHLFEQFSSALQWILEKKFNVGYCVHVLDDFLFVGPPRSPDCYSSLLAFYSLAKDINLPIKSEKTVYPTTTLTYLRKHHSPESPLFSFMDNTPVLRQYFTSQLQLALKFGNLDLSKYQAHSFRIGAATSAAATGYTDIQIQNMGR